MVKEKSKRARNQKRAKKERNLLKKKGPKKPLSGFMFFSSERRKTLKEEQPNLKITEASVVIGAEWKKLTEAEKEPYLTMAKDDKVRYEKQKEDYDNHDPKTKVEKAPDENEEEKEEEKEAPASDDDDDEESD